MGKTQISSCNLFDFSKPTHTQQQTLASLSRAMQWWCFFQMGRSVYSKYSKTGIKLELLCDQITASHSHTL